MGRKRIRCGQPLTDEGEHRAHALEPVDGLGIDFPAREGLIDCRAKLSESLPDLMIANSVSPLAHPCIS
jgi:hypothetical protein